MFRGQTFLEITFKQMPRLTKFEYLSKGYKEKLSIFENFNSNSYYRFRYTQNVTQLPNFFCQNTLSKAMMLKVRIVSSSSIGSRTSPRRRGRRIKS